MTGEFRPCGDTEIDRIRRDVAENPGTPENFAERALMLTSWLSLLQRQGINLVDYIPMHDALQAAARDKNADASFAAIRDAYALLESVQANPPAQPELKEHRTSNIERPTPNEDWPVYGANIHHTASTPDPGPLEGRIAWKFPVGLGWYARPTVEDTRVYVVSPGLRNLLYCLDLESGDLIWKTRRDWPEASTRLMLGRGHVVAQSYATQSVASTPILHGDTVILNELGAQGLDYGKRCLTWINKSDGSFIKRSPAGEGADYRIGYAAMTGNEEVVVYPDSIQHIGTSPPQCVGQNRIACRKASGGELDWEFHIGQTFCEPVLYDGQVFTGTADGMVFCLNTTGASAADGFGVSDRRRVAWAFKAGGAVNVSPDVSDQSVVFGANDGCVYSLNKADGTLNWKTELPNREPHAFKFASRPVISDGRIYIGTAGKQLCCLDSASGTLLWTADMPDWIRSRPVVVDGTVFAAAMDGSLHGIDSSGAVMWSKTLDEHPIYSDLVYDSGKLLVTSSKPIVSCVDAASGDILWRHYLLEHTDVDGERVCSDDMAAGGYYQSKPTAADGKIFVGTPSRFVYAFDYATGKELWRFELGAAVSGAPAYSNGKVFIGQQGGEEYFYALDAETGDLAWKKEIGWVWSSANADSGKLYIPGVDSFVYCVDEETGHILWRHRTGMACHPEAPIEGDRVFFGSWDHYVYAYNKNSGDLLWQFHTGGTPDSGAPIAYGDRFYLPLGGKTMCCLDPEDASTLWEHEITEGCMNASPCLWKDRIYLSVNIRSGAIPCVARIRCLDAATGKQLWEHPGGGITGPAIADGKVYTASTADNWFRCFDAETGEEHWRVAMNDRVYESVPCIYGGKAYILCDGGWLYAFA